MSKTYKDYYSAFSNSSAQVAVRSVFNASLDSSLLTSPFSDMSVAEKRTLLSETLDKKIHGLSFSPYKEGQAPGCDIDEGQIHERLAIISPHCKWIRTFSCTGGNQKIPQIAHEMGLKTMVGISLGEDREMNEREFAAGLQVARSGGADILAVGNEVLLRGDLTEQELLAYIQRAKQEIPGLSVGYVDAYFLFENHPLITAACDVILINCYPFWEYCPAEYAVPYMNEMYQRAVSVANGKKVIISETGWPDEGAPYGAAVPGHENALNYFLEATHWADEQGIELFYFSSFDESWKVGDEGDVGAYWGLWDQHGELKYK